MTYPRSALVSSTEPGYYHCVSRCVRRAFLCGEDRLTGQSFEHRRRWVEDRLYQLAEVFAISVYAYAVMSNHLHVVAYVDPAVAVTWTDADVAERWVRLCPIRVNGQIDAESCRARAAAIALDPVRVALYRQRLTELSWFMRCLSEPIARQANREDACTGRFWEGRYKCQALLDEVAVMACMVYVDLNPIRSGVARDLPASSHTSICRRLQQGIARATLLMPVAGPRQGRPLSVDLEQYVELVDWTGRQRAAGKRGCIGVDAPPVLARYELEPQAWCHQVSSIETGYWRAIGTVQSLMNKAKELGQCWLKGGGVGRQLQRMARLAGR